MRHQQRGFTLIEAAVAIAVVAILSGIVVPLVIKNIQDSQVARAKNDVQVLAAALASQIKDTGTRPMTGAGTFTLYGSGGSDPTNAATTGTFLLLFAQDKAVQAAQDMFYTPGTVTWGNEFSYKGAYLAADVAAKSDPWGSKYLILGYNQPGQTANSPIWVVCSGPDKTVHATNVPGSANPNPTWNTTLPNSADDIVVRVN